MTNLLIEVDKHCKTGMLYRSSLLLVGRSYEVDFLGLQHDSTMHLVEPKILASDRRLAAMITSSSVFCCVGSQTGWSGCLLYYWVLDSPCSSSSIGRMFPDLRSSPGPLAE